MKNLNTQIKLYFNSKYFISSTNINFKNGINTKYNLSKSKFCKKYKNLTIFYNFDSLITFKNNIKYFKYFIRNYFAVKKGINKNLKTKQTTK